MILGDAHLKIRDVCLDFEPYGLSDRQHFSLLVAALCATEHKEDWVSK